MNNILIRDLPESVCNWVKQESEERRVSQNALLVSILKELAENSSGLHQDSAFMPVAPEAAVPAASFTFIDLFAGIGGFRLALEQLGGKCLFSSEWDIYSLRTYRKWFGEAPHGDITKVPIAEIPDHDVLAAGFPCQPFSIAGVSKKNSLGRAHGFKDVTQGTLFFHLASIVEIKRPPVLILENVKNLLSHDKGQTWNVIHQTLTELGYCVFHKVIDAAGWVPQHRERIFIVCFDRHVFGSEVEFEFPAYPVSSPCLADILEQTPDKKYTLSDHLWNYLQQYAKKHREKGNGFGFGIADKDGVTRTLSARYHKDGSEILIEQGDGQNPRRLTPRECARLMGFDDELPIVVSDTQAYRQFGNAVVPKVALAVGEKVVEVIRQYVFSNGNGCLVKGKLSKTG